MSSQPLGVAFVGAGAVAELHHQALTGLESASLRGFYDPASERPEWNVRAYGSYAELLGDPGVEAVFILSPVELHVEHALTALEAGRHVLVEKPVALSPNDCRRLATTAAQRSLVCMPGHNYVYQPDLWRARRLIERGELGRICATWVTFLIEHSETLAARYPGVLRQIMTHHVYTLLYLLGRPARLSAFASRLHYERLEREDQVLIAIEMPSGALVSLFGSFAADDHTSNPWTFLVKVVGTRGGVSFSWRDAFFLRPVGTLANGLAVYEESFTYQARHFVENCVGSGEAPLSTLEDAALAQEIIEAAERAIAQRQVIEF